MNNAYLPICFILAYLIGLGAAALICSGLNCIMRCIMRQKLRKEHKRAIERIRTRKIMQNATEWGKELETLRR